MVEMKICPTCGTEYEPKERFCPRDGTALRTQGGVSDLVGQVVADRYHVLRKLGAGGMGQVYLAEHVKMGRKSALKVMHPAMGSDPDAISRFNREASNASRINHPHVAAIYDFGETAEGLIYLAMELVEGQPLTALVEQLGALPVERVAGIVTQTASGLAAAHDLGIVHRDLKPDNIMIARNRDGSDCVKVVDFGIAKAGTEGNQKVTRTGLVVGTPEYMSPEQLAGDKLDGRSDVYSLGLVAFNLLTGTLPFPSTSAQASMIMRLTDRPKTLAEMRPETRWPDSVQRVMDRVLALPVEERYQAAPDFARDLARALDEMPRSALNADGTLVMASVVGSVAAAAGSTVPPTRVAGSGGVRTATLPASVREAAAAEPRERSHPRSRAPMLATAAVLGAVLLGGAGWLATRDRAPEANPADSAGPVASIPVPGDSVVGTPDLATATLAANGASATQAGVRPTSGSPEPAAGPVAGGSPSDAAEADAEKSAPGTAFAEIERQAEAAASDRALAQRLLRRIEENMPPATRPRQRMVATKLRADMLAALDRRDEACELLRQVRDARRVYALMSAQFHDAVELYFEEASGPACQ